MGHRIHDNMLNHGSLFRVIKDFMVQGGDFLKVRQGIGWSWQVYSSRGMGYRAMVLDPWASTVNDSKMKTLQSSTTKQDYCPWLIQDPTLMDANSLSLATSATFWMENTLYLDIWWMVYWLWERLVRSERILNHVNGVLNDWIRKRIHWPKQSTQATR